MRRFRRMQTRLKLYTYPLNTTSLFHPSGARVGVVGGWEGRGVGSSGRVGETVNAVLPVFGGGANAGSQPEEKKFSERRGWVMTPEDASGRALGRKIVQEITLSWGNQRVVQRKLFVVSPCSCLRDCGGCCAVRRPDARQDHNNRCRPQQHQHCLQLRRHGPLSRLHSATVFFFGSTPSGCLGLSGG